MVSLYAAKAVLAGLGASLLAPSASAIGPVDDTQGAPTAISAAPSTTITINNFAFGGPITAHPGETVTVVNNDTAPRNVTAPNGAFRTGAIASGQSARFVAPSAAGRYPFTRTIHPNMRGLLVC